MAAHRDDDHSHEGLTVEVERTAPCTASVRFRVTADELRRSREIGLRNAGKRTRMKGFRPGKAPLSMLEKMFGDEIDRQLVQHFVQHAFERAVAEEELRPAAQPRVDLAELAAEPGQDLEHQFEILLRPEIELKQVEGLEVEGRPVTVEEGELDEALVDLRRQFSRPEPAGDEGLSDDGMAVCKVEFFRAEADEPVVARDGIRLSPRTAPRGVDPEAFAEALTGAREGETREVPIAFPEDFPVEEARGETGRLRVGVTEAFRIVPPTDEELFERFEVADEAGLRETIRDRIRESKEEEEGRRIENALLEKLIDLHPMDLPEPLVEEQAQARMSEMVKLLEAQVPDEIERERRLVEEHQRALEASRRALRAVYLMEEIAREKDLLVKDEDLRKELAAIAARNSVDVAEVRKYYQEEGLVQQLALELLERKVRSFLRESADIRLPGAAR